MSTNDAALRQFLRQHVTDDRAVDRALESLSPFLAIADKGRYPLESASRLNVGAFAVVMWEAFGLAVNRCSFLHAAVPLSERPWTDGALRLDDLTVCAYGDECPRWYFGVPFERAFSATIGDGIDSALSATMAKEGLLAGVMHPGQMVCAVLRARIALIASGRDDKELAALCDLVTRWIPLVQDGCKRGSWYVVVGS